MFTCNGIRTHLVTATRNGNLLKNINQRQATSSIPKQTQNLTDLNLLLSTEQSTVLRTTCWGAAYSPMQSLKRQGSSLFNAESTSISRRPFNLSATQLLQIYDTMYIYKSRLCMYTHIDNKNTCNLIKLSQNQEIDFTYMNQRISAPDLLRHPVASNHPKAFS